MREFIMPAGRFSGRRYANLTPAEYKVITMEESGHLNLIVVNESKITKPRDMRRLAGQLRDLADVKDDLNRTDTITLVTDKLIIWEWLHGVVVDGSLDHTIAITKNDSLFDITPLPESEVILELTDARSALLIPKMPLRQNVQSSIMCSVSRIHWALGVLKQSGRPDVSIYVDLKSISPEMRGAST